jgi:aryl-alcohol dehydrogenase-like predicted oxidoreductase
MKLQQVVIGTWPLSGDFGPVGLRQVADTLETCWDLGFREYDAAPNYGNGFIEFSLNKTIARRPGFLLNTKCGNIPFEGKSFAVESLKRSVEQSLKRSGVECLNVLFLHNPRTEVTDYGPLLSLMEELKKEGKIRQSGISLAKGYPYPDGLLQSFDVVQDDVNLLYLDPLLRNYVNRPVLMARSPLASGLLGGRISRTTQFEAGDQRGSWMKGERLDSILKRVEKLQTSFAIPVSQLARRYLLSQPLVDKVIFGVKRPEHVREIRLDLDLPALPQADMDLLMELYRSDFGLTNERHLSY